MVIGKVGPSTTSIGTAGSVDLMGGRVARKLSGRRDFDRPCLADGDLQPLGHAGSAA